MTQDPATKAAATQDPATRDDDTAQTATAQTATAPRKRAARASKTPPAEPRKTIAQQADERAAAWNRPAPAPRTPPVKKPAALKVREDESPWTESELAAVQAGLEQELRRLKAEVTEADTQIADLIRDSGDGAGDDQTDSGSKAFEREHEMTLANNARELVEQNERALRRIADGTYGTCELCGNAVGKRRLQAFPRATLCVTCKQSQERH